MELSKKMQSLPQSHPSQSSGLTHGSPRTCRTGRPRCVRGQPARLASWETQRASRDHADGFLSNGSRTGRITVPHAGPTMLHRSMSHWGELHQLPLLSSSTLSYSRRPPSLPLFLGSCSSAPQERGGGDWEPRYFSPLLSLSGFAPPLSMSLFSLTFIHIFHPLLSFLTSPTSRFSQSVLARSHLHLLSLLLQLNIPTGKKHQNCFF